MTTSTSQVIEHFQHRRADMDLEQFNRQIAPYDSNNQEEHYEFYFGIYGASGTPQQYKIVDLKVVTLSPQSIDKLLAIGVL